MKQELNEVRESDLYFLKNLQDAIQSLNVLDEIIETDGKRQSDKDMEISDYLHILEELSEDAEDQVFARLGRKISRLRKERRHLKNEYLLINEYQQIKARLSSKENRQFITSSMHRRMKELNQPYKFRIITDDVIKSVTKVENKEIIEQLKRGRKQSSKSKEIDEHIWDLYKQGISQKEIAKKLNITQPTVCMRLKKMKEEKNETI